MPHILLLLLKIIGILLSAVLSVLLLTVFFVLFVPVRYRIKAEGNPEHKETLRANVKVTWLFPVFSLLFSYPDAAFVRVRLLFFTVFNSSKPPKKKREKNKTEAKRNGQGTAKHGKEPEKEETLKERVPKEEIREETPEREEPEGIPNAMEELPDPSGSPEEAEVKGFLKNLLEKIKNIKYTIESFCDKIKKIIENIGYYAGIIQSEIFRQAFGMSKKQLKRILKSLRPDKLDIRLTIGTGDPAGTGQVLAVYGMAYPFVGNNISVQADFENRILEGTLYIKGKVTAFVFLKAAFAVYRDKNIRQLLKLLKREEA